MKSAILMGLLLSAAGMQAQAGAFGFNCSNSYGTIQIDKQEASILSENLIGSDAKPVKEEYVSKSLKSFADESASVIGTKFIRIETKGKKVILSDKTGKTSCGDDKYETIFSVRIQATSQDKKLLADDYVICRESLENGHCMDEE